MLKTSTTHTITTYRLIRDGILVTAKRLAFVHEFWTNTDFNSENIFLTEGIAIEDDMARSPEDHPFKDASIDRVERVIQPIFWREMNLSQKIQAERLMVDEVKLAISNRGTGVLEII